ncbi:KR domain-containing protein [Streptomyces stramineus]
MRHPQRRLHPPQRPPHPPTPSPHLGTRQNHRPRTPPPLGRTHRPPPQPNPHTLTHLPTALTQTTEDQLAIRPTGLHTRRLTRTTPTTPTTPWTPHGTILITGATGALATHIAHWINQHHPHCHLLLTTRQNPHPPHTQQLQQQPIICDITDKEALTRLLNTIPSEHPLTTVIHTEESNAPVLLSRCNPTDLVAATAPKAVAAGNLHELLRDHASLEQFILFSSSAAVWGAVGHGAHAAANAYLDALATHRHTQGLPATSIAWGPWEGNADGGMSDAGVVDHMRRHGLTPMPADLALAALEQAVSQDQPNLVVADVDWAAFVPAYGSNSTSCFQSIPEAQAATPAYDSPPHAGEVSRSAHPPESKRAI